MMDQSNNFITLYNHDDNNKLDVKNPSEISFLEGATFTPIITFPSPTKIRFEWTNNRGLPNPEPMEFDIPMGNGDMVKAIFDKNGNDIVDNAETLMGHSYDEIKKMIDDAYYQRYATVNYKDTTIHANNSLKRNLVDENTKIEVLGQTIQNHANASGFEYQKQHAYIYSKELVALSFPTIKDKTEYTIIVYGLSFNLVSFAVKDSNSNNPNSNTAMFNGKNYTKFTTNIVNPLTNNCLFFFTDGSLTEEQQAEIPNMKVMILEGDWTNKEVSFVPFGLNYPATTEVVENGRNLLDLNTISTLYGGSYEILDSGNTLRVSGNNAYSGCLFNLEKFIDGKTRYYTYSGSKQISSEVGSLSVQVRYVLNGESKYIPIASSSFIEITFPKEVTECHLRIIVNNQSTTLQNNATYDVNGLMIQSINDFSDFEPYVERKINIDKPLASVNDTERDRYYVKDGKKYHDETIIMQTFDGSENWIKDTVFQSDKYTRFILTDNVNRIPYQALCDKIYVRPESVSNGEFEYILASNLYVHINIAKEKLLSDDVSGFKTWLSQNNVKLFSVRKTPITTEIETEDWYSFDGQTNITTTNTVKPTLDIDIPSDLNAVTSNLIAENMALKQENQALSNEFENQASSIEAQKANMDYISMMTGVEL